jgi:hypothetical protein
VFPEASGCCIGIFSRTHRIVAAVTVRDDRVRARAVGETVSAERGLFDAVDE